MTRIQIRVVWAGMADYVYDLTALSDEELLARSLGSPPAFEVLLVRYQKDFLKRAMRVVGSRDDAEDVVQEAFVRIYRFAPRFREDAGTFRAWALTILMNAARTRYQKAAKERARTAALTPEHYAALAGPDEHGASEAKDAVSRALEKAPKDVAHILTLAYLKGLPYREIAAREQMTESAVKVRVFRAKKVLRDLLDES